MPVNSTHPDYDATLPSWLRARDVIAGEDAVKSAGEKYLPRLDAQTDEEYGAYRARASFFNATARTADGYLGLLFRRPPFIKVPEGANGLGKAIWGFVNDAGLYASGTGQGENRVYASLYVAENILNWRVERIHGRNVLTLLVLHEAVRTMGEEGGDVADWFQHRLGE